MILQALHELYSRIPGIDRPGFAPLPVSWSVIIDHQGTLVALVPLKKVAERGKQLVPTSISAPTSGKRTIKDKPGFLADKTDYVLGYHPACVGDESAAKKLRRRFELFREAHVAAQQEISHPDFDAVCKFLTSWEPNAADVTERIEKAAGVDSSHVFGDNVVFQISGKTGFVHELPEVVRYWSRPAIEVADSLRGVCLVTGQPAILARLHEPAIKGVDGAQTSGASLVSFNIKSFTSYGKEQGFNAPVAKDVAFAYCTALNWLLAQKSRRFHIADTTVVFWTAKPSAAEDIFPWMIAGVPDIEDLDTRNRVRQILERLVAGTLGRDELGDPAVDYYVLGLSPNAARLSVRFWHQGTLIDLIAKLKLHFAQLALTRGWESDPAGPTVFQLLRQTSRDVAGIQPLLGGQLLRSIIIGSRYPDALAQGVMNRIRVVEKKAKGEGSVDSVSYLRASILKAWLLRNHGAWLKQQNITMETALHKANPNVAYQLGRLFAGYEQIQRSAHDYKLDRTIRDTMFSAASATPLSVFGRLDRLNKHHLRKLSPGAERFFGDLIDEIHQKIRSPDFYPPALNLKEQSLFCIGYYHQRHELLHKSVADTVQSNMAS